MADRPIYQVVDWDKHFENAGSRKVARLSWVAIPNRHDGAGFRRVMREADGLAIYGAWCIIVEVASRCPRRGVLVNDLGEAIDAADLADKCGGEQAVFERAFVVLTDSRIRWLETSSSTLLASSSTLLASGRGVPVASQHRTGPDRTGTTVPTGALTCDDRNGNGKDKVSILTSKLIEQFGLSSDEAQAQEQSFRAVAARLLARDDRRQVVPECLALAAKKAGSRLRNPMAAWQREANSRWP